MASTPKKHHQDRPDFTAALRSVTWQYALTGAGVSPGRIQAEVQLARQGMGLPPYRGGAVSDYLQRRTRGTKLQQQDNQPIHYELEGKLRIPTKAIRDNWRFLSAADHAEVRLVARQGLLQTETPVHHVFSTRGVHLPSLVMLIGSIADVRNLVETTPHFRDRRGLYLLSGKRRNYVGQTGEFHTRGRSHSAKGAEFAIFAFPAEQTPVEGDPLNVAEALANVSLSELLDLTNDKLGFDAPPQPLRLREGSAFALAFVAGIARWAHDNADAAHDVLMWRTDVRGLAEKYTTLLPYVADPGSTEP